MPKTVMPATLYLKKGENIFSIRETNENAPDSTGFRRYQTITVVRDDKLTEYRTDMGSAKSYIKEPFQIICLFEHTVEEALHMADQLRDKPFSLDGLPGTDILGGYLAYAEMKGVK